MAKKVNVKAKRKRDLPNNAPVTEIGFGVNGKGGNSPGVASVYVGTGGAPWGVGFATGDALLAAFLWQNGWKATFGISDKGDYFLTFKPK